MQKFCFPVFAFRCSGCLMFLVFHLMDWGLGRSAVGWVWIFCCEERKRSLVRGLFGFVDRKFLPNPRPILFIISIQEKKLRFIRGGRKRNPGSVFTRLYSSLTLTLIWCSLWTENKFALYLLFTNLFTIFLKCLANPRTSCWQTWLDVLEKRISFPSLTSDCHYSHEMWQLLLYNF